MKKILKWVAIVLGTIIVLAFLGFLYFIPPFTIAPPETFSGPEQAAPPSLDNITDPAERAIAERGKYIVTVTGCTGCHTPGGDTGPIWDEYLAGGATSVYPAYGKIVARNLTSDKETGLARRTDEELDRVLRSGVLSDGRQAYYRDMPWPSFANWTPEDRHAVIVYLRHLKAVYHHIPDPVPASITGDSKATEMFVTVDGAIHDRKK